MTIRKNVPEIELKFKSGKTENKRLRSSIDVAEMLMSFYNQDTIELTESVIILYLNSANKAIGWIKHSSGGTAHTVFDVKMMMAPAIISGASAIILSHNHPAGQLSSSVQDDNITKKAKDACAVFGITLLDHVIVAPDGTYYSYADEGKL
jgi:DNA repair protein RadC